MLGRWITRVANDKQIKEIGDFIDILRSMDDDEIGLAVVMAHGARLGMLEGKGLDFMYPAECVVADPSIAVTLNANIRLYQREGRPQYAAGTMVWLHSLRPFYATAKPELRNLAREMWQEFSRGFPYVDDWLEQGHPDPSTRPDSSEMKMFPDGLSPR